jgi:MFS family permease
MRRIHYFLLPFLMDMIVAASGLILNLRAQDLGASALDLGLLGFAWGVPFCLFSALTGVFMARVDRRALVCAGAVLFGLANGLFTRASHPAHLILLVTLSGVACALFWPVFETLLHSPDSGETHARLGSFNVGWTLGLMTGSAGGGYLYRGAGPTGAFLTLTAVAALIGAYLFLLLRRDEPAAAGAEHEPGEELSPEERAVPPARRRGYLTIAWVANFALYFGSAVAATLFPRLGRTLAFGDGPIGVILAVMTAVQGVTFFLCSRSGRWHYRIAPLGVAQGLGAGGLVCIAVGSGALAFAAGFALIGLGRGMTYTASLFYGLDAEAARGHHTGLHEAILGSAMFLGPLLAGVSATAGSLRLPFLLTAALVGVALGVESRMWRALPGVSVPVADAA